MRTSEASLDERVDRLSVYEAIVRFIRESALRVEADDDELLSAIAAAYSPRYLRPLPVVPEPQ